jgi:hypothetical protein
MTATVTTLFPTKIWTAYAEDIKRCNVIFKRTGYRVNLTNDRGHGGATLPSNISCYHSLWIIFCEDKFCLTTQCISKKNFSLSKFTVTIVKTLIDYELYNVSIYFLCEPGYDWRKVFCNILCCQNAWWRLNGDQVLSWWYQDCQKETRQQVTLALKQMCE